MVQRAKRDDPPTPDPGTKLRGRALGIDIGGSGVKAALVDLATGELASERIREKTPHPATPDAVAAVTASVVARTLQGTRVGKGLAVGCGLPGVIKDGRLKTTANIDPTWLDISAEEVIGAAIDRSVLAINDADAAGIAEVTYGAARGEMGTVLVLTIGTGIGSALFIDGRLVPNTELGHLELHGKDAETRVSGASRERRTIGWKRWSLEFDEYLDRMEAYLWPDLIILGGGVSKEMARFEKSLTSRAPVRPAIHLNAAGIIGAAYAAASASPSAGPARSASARPAGPSAAAMEAKTSPAQPS